jgi:hypothetical protein
MNRVWSALRSLTEGKRHTRTASAGYDQIEPPTRIVIASPRVGTEVPTEDRFHESRAGR